MTALFTAEREPEQRYRIELPREDGTREFVCFVRESEIAPWEAIGCVATPVPQWPWEVEQS